MMKKEESRMADTTASLTTSTIKSMDLPVRPYYVNGSFERMSMTEWFFGSFGDDDKAAAETRWKAIVDDSVRS